MKKKFICVALVIVLSLSVLIGFSYAFYVEKETGWPQDIQSASVIFTVNDKTITTVTNRNLGLVARGSEVDLVFDVRVTANYIVSSLAEYQFTFSLVDPDTLDVSGDPNFSDFDKSKYKNNVLARAIEVYEYIDGEYVYVSNLTNFLEYKNTVPVSLQSETALARRHTFKLVYSAAAGDYYEDKGFVLHMDATAKILNSTESDTVFITSNESILRAIELGDDMKGKTLTLLSDIILPAGDYNFSTKVGFDLNGHTLTLAPGATLRVNYSGGVASDALYNDLNLESVGIYNSVPASGGITGTGFIEISCPNDFMYVQDSLSALSQARINVKSYSFDAIIRAMNNQARGNMTKIFVPGGSVDFYKNLNYYIDYFQRPSPTAVSVAPNMDAGKLTLSITSEDASVIDLDSSKNPIINTSYNEDITMVRIIRVAAARDGYTNKYVDLSFGVRGSGSESIAEYLMSEFVPDSIENSIFLPGYDVATKATITWVSGDKNFLTDTGSYLNMGQSGKESPLAVEDLLDDWNDKQMKLGVIVDVSGDQTYAEKNINVIIYNAKERTDRVFNYQQFIMEEEKSILDLYNKYIHQNYAYKAHLAGLGIKIYEATNYDKEGKKLNTKLVSVRELADDTVLVQYVDVVNDKIVLKNVETEETVILSTTKTVVDAATTRYTATDENGIEYTVVLTNELFRDGEYYTNTYVEVIGTEANPAKVDILFNYKPEWDKAVIVETDINFIYDNNGTRIEYAVPKDVTVIGYKRSVELTDAKPFLQSDFETNVYILDGVFEFFVKAFTMQGAFVDYYVPDEYSQYVQIENYIFAKTVHVADAEGDILQINGEYQYHVDPANDLSLFIKIGNDYFYSPRYDYDEETGLYTRNTFGDYMVVDGVPYKYDDEVAAGHIYTHYSRIRVLPARLPAVESIISTFVARFYTELEPGTGEPFINPETGEPNYSMFDGEYATCELTLVLYGVYHYTAAEIPDFALYNKLLKYFDVNNNQWIEVREAAVSWDELLTNTSTLAHLTPVSTDDTSVSGKSYDYLDLSSLLIESIKGMEYFTGGLKGLSFANNRIADISALSRMYNLQYINLLNNYLANLQSLEYLDSTEYLNLSLNNITSVAALQYLQEVIYLDISYNNSLSDFTPISEWENLAYVSVVQSTDNIINRMDVIYALSLLAGNSQYSTIYRNSATAPWEVTVEQIVAASALSELLVIDELYSTLNIPSTYRYSYRGITKTYELRWEVTNIGDQAFLQFVEDANGRTIGYVILSPIVDRDIGITVSVLDSDNASSAVALLSRMISVKLLSSNDPSVVARIQIADSSDESSFVLASDLVPDGVLLSLLFEALNTNTTGTVGTSPYDEKYTLSYAEINATGGSSIIDFSNAGISDLEGLRHFPAAWSGKHLMLDGNTFTDADISELAYCVGMTGLTLTGQRYDFGTLIHDDEGLTKLSTLTTLNVYGSYDLDADDVLAGLYKVYLANSSRLAIYKDSASEAWDPYLKLMPLYAQSLPSAIALRKLDSIKSFYEDGQSCYTFNFYGQLDIDFVIYSASLRGATENSNNSMLALVGSSGNYTGVKLTNLSNQNDALYVKVALRGHDGKRTVERTHNILIILETDYDILVCDFMGDREVPLDVIFPGRSLRTAVLSKVVNMLRNTASAGSKTSVVSGGGYYYDSTTEKIYMSMKTLSDFDFTGQTLTIDGTLYTSGFSFGGHDYKPYGAMDGLKYTSISDVIIVRDARIGDGSELVNLTSFQVYGSIVDLTDIDRSLPNLRTLKIGYDGAYTPADNAAMYLNRAFFYEKDGINHFSYFPNINTLHILASTVRNWDFLSVFYTGAQVVPITELKIYSTMSVSTKPEVVTTVANYNNANSNSPDAESVIRVLYNSVIALLGQGTAMNYRIGSPESEYDADYLYSPTDWPESLHSNTEITDTDEEKEYLEFYADVLALGLKVTDATGTNYYYASTREPTSSIFLPRSTYDYMTGTDYLGSGGYFNRGFEIKWVLNGIDAATATALFGTSTSYTFVDITTNTLGSKAVYVRNNTRKDLTLTLIAGRQYDCYFLLEGIIGSHSVMSLSDPAYPGYTSGYYNYVYDANGDLVSNDLIYTPYNFSSFQSYIYPMLVRADVNNPNNEPKAPAGYRSYAEFTDISFRTAMYLVFASSGSHVAAGGYIDPTELGSITSFTVFTRDFTSSTSTSNTYISYIKSGVEVIFHANASNVNHLRMGTAAAGNFCTYAVNTFSIDGIGMLTGLQTLNIWFQWVSDLTPLASLSDVLTDVNFTANRINDISVLSTFTRLKTAWFSNNQIYTIIDANNPGYSVFHNSRSTLLELDLAYNSCICADDILALGNSAFTASGTFNLRIADSLCDYDPNLYVGLANFTAGRPASNVGTFFYHDYGGVGNRRRLYYTGNLPQGFVDAIIKTSAEGGDPTVRGYIENGVDYSQLATLQNSTVTITSLIGTTNRAIVYTISFVNYANITSYAATDNSTVVMQITSNGTGDYSSIGFSVRYEIKLLYGGYTSRYTLQSTASSPVMTADDFDPAIWAYLTKEFQANGTLSGSTYIYNLSVLDITSDRGIRSLKGLEKITGLTTLKISNNPFISELWTGSLPNVTGMRLRLIRGRLVDEQMLATALAYCPKLLILHLLDFEFLDYTKPVVLDSVTTCLAEVLTNRSRLPALRSFSVSIGSSLSYFGTENILDITRNLFDAAGNFFGYALSAPASGANTIAMTEIRSGKAYSSFTGNLGNTSLHKRLYQVCEPEVLLYNSFYNTSGFKTFYLLDGTSIGNESILIAEVNMLSNNMEKWFGRSMLGSATVNELGNLSTTVDRETVPSEIYENDIRTKVTDGGGNTSYVSENDAVYYLPQRMTYLGSEFALDWRVFISETSVSAVNNVTSTFIKTTAEGMQFFVDLTNIQAGLDYGTVYIRGYRYTTSGARAYTDPIPVTFIKSDYNYTSPSTAVKVAPFYFQLYLENGETPLSSRNYDPARDGRLQLVDASLYIESPLMIHTLFHSITSALNAEEADAIDADGNSIVIPASTVYYISYYYIYRTTSISFSWSTAQSYNQPVSIEGIQLFFNVTSVALSNTGIIDLSPLSTLHLKNFSFSTAAHTTSYVVDSGWLSLKPLWEGSMNTLTTFSLYSAAYDNVPDISYLRGFTALTRINMYTGGASSNYNLVLESVPFRNLVAWFDLYKPEVEIYTHSNMPLTGASSPIPYLQYIKMEETSLYRIHATSELLKAAVIFNAFDASASGVTLSDNFLLTPHTYTVSAGKAAVELPSHITYGGENFAVQWKQLNSYVEFDRYVYRGATSTFSIPSGAVTLSDGMTVTYEQLEELLVDSTYNQLLFTGRGGCRALMQVEYIQSRTFLTYGVLMRINVDGFDFDSGYYIESIAY